jgi:NAD(P)-dependent dehydrogenase (short-subunit alcohol dehydrogenase family)
VAVVGRRPEPLAEVVARIDDDGGTAIALPADVTDLDAMVAAVAATVARFGHLDLVVANAGAAPAFGPVVDTTPAVWHEIVDLNLTGVWHTAKAAVPALVDAGGGTIIVVGSGAGRANSGGLGAYSAAKAGAAALTRVLAAELREARIAVNELVPGPVLTPAISIFGTTDPDELAEHVRGIGEWLKSPEEVARRALYLAGLPTDGTTGQSFSLMGRLV